MREKFLSDEGYEAGLAFQPRASDVLISPFAKSGTTWLQHIAHGLRTRGSLDFDEITEVTPWIEVAHDIGWDLNAEQVAQPRIFKSHLTWQNIPKGGRYICSIRNPYAVAVSLYRFFEGWWFEPGSIRLETFILDRFTRDPENRGYWQHLISWWEAKKNDNVLLLCYEDMKADLPRTVQTVARFMGIALDDELLDMVVRQSSKEFMLAHKSLFDDQRIHKHFESRGGAPADPNTAKVTSGAGDHEQYQLSPEIKEELDAVWHEIIYQRIGFEDYSALREAIAGLPNS